MKRSILIITLLLLQSCDYFQVKKISKDRIVQDQIETLNWEEVDEYPSFKACDSLPDKDDKRACFETELTNHIFNVLNDTYVSVDEDVDETIFLDVLVTDKGKVIIKHKDINEKTRQIIPEIDTLLIESLNTLPEIYPAIKRGQYVKTQFKLPIQIKVDSL